MKWELVGYLAVAFGLFGVLIFLYVTSMKKNSNSEDTSRLTNVYPKINRAREILEFFNFQVVDWKNSEPYEFVTEKSEDSRKFVLGIRFTNEPNFHFWSLLIGEFLHNLRCALDHSIYQLAFQENENKPPENYESLMFPITTSSDRFRQSKKSRLKGLTTNQIGIIENFQPYNTDQNPTDSPLYHLHELNNIDKHRYLHLATLTVRDPKLDLSKFEEGEYKFSINEDPLDKEDWMVGIETKKPKNGLELELRASIRLGINEENYKNRQILEIMNNSLVTVIKVVSELGIVKESEASA